MGARRACGAQGMKVSKTSEVFRDGESCVVVREDVEVPQQAEMRRRAEVP